MPMRSASQRVMRSSIIGQTVLPAGYSVLSRSNTQVSTPAKRARTSGPGRARRVRARAVASAPSTISRTEDAVPVPSVTG